MLLDDHGNAFFIFVKSKSRQIFGNFYLCENFRTKNSFLKHKFPRKRKYSEHFLQHKMERFEKKWKSPAFKKDLEDIFVFLRKLSKIFVCNGTIPFARREYFLTSMEKRYGKHSMELKGVLWTNSHRSMEKLPWYLGEKMEKFAYIKECISDNPLKEGNFAG